MPNQSLVLLTAPECHLCGHAREVLDQIRSESGHAWTEVSAETPEGSRLAEGAPPLRPLLFRDDGSLLAAGRLSAKRLRRDLGLSAPVAATEGSRG